MLSPTRTAAPKVRASIVALSLAAMGLVAGFPVNAEASADAAPSWSRLATPPGPDVTMYATTVYAPEFHELIVFGGDTAHGLTNELWTIDPSDSNSTWTLREPSGPAPAPREAAPGIWDPVRHQMVVFGGLGIETAAAQYENYNDVWALRFQPDGTPAGWTRLGADSSEAGQVENVQAPSARWNGTAVYDSKHQRLIMIGGTNRIGNTTCVNGFSQGSLGALSGYCGLPDSWAFDLAGQGGWTLLNPNGPRLAWNQAFYDPQADTVYAIRYQDPYNGWEENPAGWSCYRLQLASAANSALPWGDCERNAINGEGAPAAPLGQAFGYSPATNSIVLPAVDPGSDPPTVSVYRWNYDDGRWTRYGGSAPAELNVLGLYSSLQGALVTDAGNESLALFGVSGGGTERGTIGDSNVYVYDMGSKSWRTVESDATLQPIFQAAPAFDEAKRQMYLIGGMVAGTMDRRPQAVWRADLETGTWKALHPGGVAPPGNEYGFDSSIGIFDPVNRRLLEFPFCGPNLDPSSSDDLFSLDVDAAKPAWSRLATGDFPDVCMPNLVFDSHRDRVLMLGGYVLIDPWQRSAEWNRDVYSLDLTSDAPTWELLDTVGIQRGSAIEDTRAVYDSTADRVLFQTYVDEGPDRYDGKDLVGLVQELTFAGGSDGVWRTVDAAGSAPAARSGAAVVFDRVNNQLVVWGGYAGVVPAGQGADPTVYTLSFNGTPTWGVMPVSGEAPRGRVLGSTAYDPAANRMVVVGGCYGGCWSTADSAQRVLSRDIYGLPLVPGAAADPASPSQSGRDPALVRPHSKLHVVGQAPTGAETNPATFDAGFAPCMINGLATGSSDVQACVPSTGSLSAEAPVQDDQPAPSRDCAASGVDDLCESWLAGYDFAGGHEGGGPGVDRPTAQALSPSGARLFTTGASWDNATLSYDFATVAIDTATHAQLWATRLDGRSFLEIPSAIAVSPDGTKVFVTGPSRHGGLDYDYMTVAYDAGTGQQLWRNTYDGPGPSRTGSYDVPTDVKVSPDGSTVFVTGAGEDGTIIQDFADDQSIGTRIGIDFDYETVAYGASDGHEKWRARMEGQTGAFTSRDFATALTLSRDGSRLFVTGASQRGSSPEPATFTYDILTAGYDTRDGGSLWTHRFDGGAWDQPTSIGVTPDGSRLFVAGFSTASNNVDSDYRTIAYNAATGTQAWTAIAGGNATAYDGRGADQAMSVAVSPTGDRVYVTGVFSGEVESGYPQSGDLDYGTVAYATDTGTVLWRKTYSMSSYDIAWSVAASPDGKRVYVTGTSLRAENAGVIGFDVATIAYEAGTGNPAWTARYNRSQAALDFDQGLGVTVSPDSKNVFATAFFGNPQDSTNNGDFGVLGYDA